MGRKRGQVGMWGEMGNLGGLQGWGERNGGKKGEVGVGIGAERGWGGFRSGGRGMGVKRGGWGWEQGQKGDGGDTRVNRGIRGWEQEQKGDGGDLGAGGEKWGKKLDQEMGTGAERNVGGYGGEKCG